jgi:hypothetical protein
MIVQRTIVTRARVPGALLSLGAALGVALLSVEVGRLVAANSVRLISLVLVALAVPLIAQLDAERLLAFTIAVSPLPLYMQGLHASLVLGLVAAVWLAWLGSRGMASQELGSSSGFGIALVAVLLTALLAFARGQSGRTGSDLAALGTLLVGMALFVACLLILRTPAAVRRAFVALCVGGALVFMVAMVQLLFPSVHIPGLLTSAGSVQVAESGVAQNLRVGGPIGDYELFAELLGLVGTAAVFFGLRSSGSARLGWLALLLCTMIGVATTSTRSGFVILVLGATACIVADRRTTGRARRTLIAVLVLGLVALPIIRELQARLGTGYLFARLSAHSHGGGLLYVLDRATVWRIFLDHLPSRGDLFLGSGPAFDYAGWGTYPHSLPLTLVFTVGILGAAAFYGLLLLIEVRCLVAWRSARSPYALLGAILVGLFAINEIKIEYVRAFNYEWFVWGMLGIAAAASRAHLREPRPEQHSDSRH